MVDPASSIPLLLSSATKQGATSFFSGTASCPPSPLPLRLLSYFLSMTFFSRLPLFAICLLKSSGLELYENSVTIVGSKPSLLL